MLLAHPKVTKYLGFGGFLLKRPQLRHKLVGGYKLQLLLLYNGSDGKLKWQTFAYWWFCTHSLSRTRVPKNQAQSLQGSDMDYPVSIHTSWPIYPRSIYKLNYCLALVHR